nr:hypothetical protein [Tanacetum cinerariifolium]
MVVKCVGGDGEMGPSWKWQKKATNGILTSKVMWDVEPHERQRHMIVELNYPLVEPNEVILFSKLTISVCGSKQEEALKWESHDKVVADTDDHHIVIEASRYQIMSFKIEYTLLEDGS